MIWLFYALLARFLWAASCAVDQLISRAHKDATAMSGLILYFCAVLPVALFCLAVSDRAFTLDASYIGWVVLAASVNVIALLPYYTCLKKDDAHNIMPYFELTPVYLVILAYLFRDEVLTSVQLLGGAIVILCGLLFSWDFKHGHVRVLTLTLMSIATFLYAIYQLSLRTVADVADVWGVCGSVMLVESVIGIAGFLIYKRARVSIMATAVETRGRTIALALLTTFLAFTGLAALVAAFQTAPTTGHVAALGPTQPFFSFFIAAVLGVVLHRHYQKVVFDRETQIKLFLITGIFAGIYLLVSG